MATVTGFTAARMLEMENATIIDGYVLGNDLILVTKEGTEINTGNVRGPQGIQGIPGPLTQSAADARYTNLAGDTMTGRLIVDGVTEGLRLSHTSSPYLSFYNGATRVGYIQGRSDLFIVNAEGANPMGFYTNGVEQMRLRTGTATEILTINGNPDALIYMRASSPSGTAYNYFGKSGGWGFRANALTGDALLQAADGDTRLQALYSVDFYPGNNFSASFLPQGHICFAKDELEDDVPGFWWRAGHNAIRTCCDGDNINSVYLNRQGAGGGVGNQFMRFGINNTTVGSISRTSGGVAYNVTSDYRSKTVKGSLTNALERIKLLRPVRAVYNNDLDKREVDTFVAHEVTQAVPEAVTGQKDAVATASNSEDLGIPIGDPILQQLDVSRLVPLLVASVQELSAKVDELQARLEPA